MINTGFQEISYTSKTVPVTEEAVYQLDQPFSEEESHALTAVLQEYLTNETQTENIECKYCHRKFRFDRIAKHETRCASSKPQGPKFDSVTHHLRNTPGAKYIAQIKEEGPITSLPIVKKQHQKDDGRLGCQRCGRRFNPESYEKHVKRCRENVNTARETKGSNMARAQESGVLGDTDGMPLMAIHGSTPIRPRARVRSRTPNRATTPGRSRSKTPSRGPQATKIQGDRYTRLKPDLQVQSEWPKIAAEQFLDYDEVDMNLDSWLNE